MTDDQKTQMDAQIRSAFIRPVEDCGTDPASVTG